MPAEALMSSMKLRSTGLLGSILIVAGTLGAQITALHVPMPNVLVESALFPAAFLGAVMGWASVRPAEAALSAFTPDRRK
jgi:hypothetical protein